MSRRRVKNRAHDRAMFRRTANRTKAVNIPGAIVSRGGIRL